MGKKSKGRRLKGKALRNQISDLFQRAPRKRYTAKQVQKKLNLKSSKDSIQAAMQHLEGENKLRQLRDGRFQFNRDSDDFGASGQPERNIYTGFVDMTRSGSAYIVCDELHEDVFVPADQLNTALHDDIVRVQLIARHRSKRLSGKIIEVVQRAAASFVGTMQLFQHYAVVEPSHFKHHIDIMVDLEDTLDAKTGDKVVVEVVNWEGKTFKTPVGKVTRVLTGLPENQVDLQSILINNGFDLDFSADTIAEVRKIKEDILQSDIESRLDLREVPTFTIDPTDAKDFDDALSYRKTDDGHVEIGVHIADVSHYLKEGTALDKDAYKRSTSVYLVGTVLPMLPEKLSNNLCSLRPDEDKLTFSALFSVDEEGRIKKTWFGKTIIHSKRRFTYEEAQEVIESGQGDFAEELKKLDLFVERLRKERMASGGIAFETDEVQFETNEQGWPIRIFRKQRKNAHLLVEDLMLLANRSVASHMAELSKGKPVPFVYRIHDTPDPEKLERFSHYAKHFGYNFDFSTPSRTAVSMNKIMGSVSGNESLRILQPLAIRCMAKAEYSIHNIGHYGLAFKHYTHFTSPIRRYSDVLVHRLLEKNLHAVFRTEMSDLESKCKHISQQERKALDAERESIKLKQVQYLSELIGEVFKGMISGIVNFGIFVELPENGCEGLVRFDKLGEPFELDDQNFTARGLHTGKLFRLGDMVQVQVIGTHQERREIDFKIL